MPRLVAMLVVAALAGCGGGVRPADRTVEVVPASPAASLAVAAPAPTASRAPAPRPPVTTRPAPMPANRASRLRTLPAATSQVIVVHTSGFDASVATLETFGKKDGRWVPAFPPMAARIGENGFADDKREGDRATPTGVYGVDGTMYGIAANPGVRYAYHVLVPGDYWNGNSDSPDYNTFTHGTDPGGPSEALWTVTPQYTHLAVIRYNMPARAGRGSGIFLHQFGPGATLGCVSLARADLVRVLTWLDPRSSPRFVMAPASVLSRY